MTTNVEANRPKTPVNSPGSEDIQSHGKESVQGFMGFLQQLSTTRIVLLICLFSALAYSNSLGGDFVYDDTDQIVKNRDIRSWDNLKRAFTTHVWAFRERPDILRASIPLPYYRPVFTVVLTVSYHLFGLWPQGWHLLTLMLHIICSLSVFNVLLILSGRRAVAAISALLFAVFPLHSESVSWISGMTDPLFGVFFLPAFYWYVKFRKTQRRRFLPLSLGAFLLAAFSKETALSLVVLVFAYELIESPISPRPGTGSLLRRVKDAALRSAPFAAVAMLYMSPRYLVFGGFTWKTLRIHERPFTDTLITLPSIILSYLGLLSYPINLSPAYNTSFVTSAASPRFLAPTLVLALIAGVLILRRRTISNEAWQSLALLFVPLLPVLNLGQLSEEYLVSDRYLYISAAGWCFLIALTVERLANLQRKRPVRTKSRSAPITATARIRQRGTLVSVAMILLLLTLTVATALENRKWADEYSLWSRAASVRPAYWAPHYNVGLSLMESKRYGEARDALNRAAVLAPREPDVFNSLGQTLDAMGDTPGAIENFRYALQIDAAAFEPLNNLGAVYYNLQDFENAERYFLRALEVKPRAAQSRFNLGKCYESTGRLPEAIREFERVVEARPDDAEAYYDLGLCYEKIGRSDDAIRSFQEAVTRAKAANLEDLASKASEALIRTRSHRQ